MSIKSASALKRYVWVVSWFRFISLRRNAHKVMAFGLVVPLVIASLSLQSCGLLGFDHRGNISQATLYDEKGALDERALSAALIAKFANSNSPPVALETFVESLAGQCSQSPQNSSMHCSIPQSGAFCVAQDIRLVAVISGGAIVDVSAKSHLDGC